MLDEKSISSIDRNPLRSMTVDDLKARLKLNGFNINSWSAKSGYKFNTVYGAITRYAGSEREPNGLMTIQILHDLKEAAE